MRRSPRLRVRVSMASVPCPTAGHMTSGASTSATRSFQPRRRRPAAASTMASYWPSSSLRSRYRCCRGSIRRAGPGDSGEAARVRRRELVPTRDTGRELPQALAHHHVVGELALRRGGDGQAFGKLGGQVFQAMNGQIDGAIEQRLFDLFGEEAFGADAVERNVRDAVAGGLDDLDRGTQGRAIPGGAARNGPAITQVATRANR